MARLSHHFENDQTFTQGTHMSDTTTTFTIRAAGDSDGFAIHRLAALDSSRPPSGDVLVAEVGDELWAAVEVATGTAVADPFRPSGELVELLRVRAEGLTGKRHGERRSLARLLPRAA
jgi:hypothetical protein